MARAVWIRKFPRLDVTTASIIVLTNTVAFFPNAKSTSDALFLEGMGVAIVGGIIISSGIRLTNRRRTIGGRLLVLAAMLLATAILIGILWIR